MQPLRAPARSDYSRPAPLRDPAPSRLAYRAERLWLTPMFRAAMRIGLPVVLVAGLVVGYLADGDRRAAIGQTVADLRKQIEERPEFMVSLMAIDGASVPVAGAIRDMLPVELPASSFALDLEAMRAAIEQIDAVADAELHIRPGGILQVTVKERQPVILWRSASGLQMLDKTGHRVANLRDRSARADLPVIAGEGADAMVAEALAIIHAARPIHFRVRGLVRMGERRWDIVLDRDQRIMLPEADPVSAIERIIALDQAEDMLGRDIATIDLRNEHRPTIRLLGGRVAALENFNGFQTKVPSQ
ncbi:MAG: cell division protein FtsQ/DivIB [Paracoccaceae bacterium]|jgi:cell division protein FtsQ|nr:cell division protein FtsQ/DivIB [Paracoccaceae bacterium]MDH5529353.1 cell division protein FtsQ/DivIB [Paracoccaceae bacterium]